MMRLVNGEFEQRWGECTGDSVLPGFAPTANREEKK
jgi:hypothetical protein